MEPRATDQNVYRLFRLSVIIKGAISLVEMLAGVLVFFVPLYVLTGWLVSLMESEVVEEPGNQLAQFLLTASAHLNIGSSAFIAFYLFSRGLIKLALVVALLKNQLWAYPSSLAVLAAFVAYQLYQIAITHSLAVVGITVFDLVVMYYVWREWAIVRAHRAP
jgi:uncharacterized membrane protein